MTRAASTRAASTRARARKSPIAPEVALLVAAALFGSTFVVVQGAIDDSDPLVFLTLRFGVAAGVLWAALWLTGRRGGSASRPLRATARLSRPMWRDGVAAGAALSVGYWTQTEGLRFTTTTASAFITYLLVVFVPLIAWLTWRRVPNGSTLVGLALALVGLFALNPGGVSLGKGELLTVGCAIAFATHIVILEARSHRHQALALAAVQLTTVAGLMATAALLSGAEFSVTHEALAAAVFTAVGASALGFSLQTWAQARVESTRAALLLTTETIVAAVLGVIVGERLSVREWAGVALILVGVVVAETRGRVPRAHTTP